MTSLCINVIVYCGLNLLFLVARSTSRKERRLVRTRAFPLVNYRLIGQSIGIKWNQVESSGITWND